MNPPLHFPAAERCPEGRDWGWVYISMIQTPPRLAPNRRSGDQSIKPGRRRIVAGALQFPAIGETIGPKWGVVSLGRSMPYIFDYDLARGILRCRLSGQVTDDVLKEFFRAGAEHAVRMHPSAGVVDLAEVTSFDVSTHTIEELARTAPVLRDPHLRRIVIAPSAEIFGMMRMFELAGEQKRPNIHVVRNEREAWAILAVQKPKFEPFEAK